MEDRKRTDDALLMMGERGRELQMEIGKITDGNAVMLSLSGKLDAHSAPALAAAVGEVGERCDLVIDLEGVTYLSSIGLRELVRAERKMAERGTFGMVNTPENVAQTLRMTGLYERLNILS